jgi:arylsulfatase A-like enzyme
MQRGTSAGAGEHAARLVALGVLVGAGAGALGALADFGAEWLWLDRWAERGWFFVRLLALHVPVGALIGASCGVLLALGEPLVRQWARRPADPDAEALRTDAGRPFILTACAAPWLAYVGMRLFTGGRMSRLPAVGAWQALTGVALCLACAVTLFGYQRLRRRARRTRVGAWRTAAALVSCALVAGKLDQRILPNLYLYLHGALTMVAFALYAGALRVVWPDPEAGRGSARRNLALAAGTAVCLAWVARWNVDTLDADQNVRVALHGPRAAHAASVMRALGPWVLEPRQRAASAAARLRARAARERNPKRDAVQGPVLDDAHVLLITVDALRADHLGAYGYGRPTSPELDRLARGAVLFERAYAQAPHSSYSISSLFTSEYLHETVGLGHPLPTATLATELALAGYRTAGFYTNGIFHTEGARLTALADGRFGLALCDHTHRPAEATTDRVLVEIDRTVSLGEPNTFLWAHYFDPHEPYESTTFGDSDMDRYDGEIRRADAAIGRLVQEARRRLSRPVIVVVTADHGEEFREHGGVYHGSTLYDEQIRVPLWFDAPGVAPRRVAAPVESIDIAPTLLGLVGLAPAPSMRGDDLRPYLAGQDPEPRPAFAAVIHKKMIVRWPHKLIADLRFGLFELYDLSRDPHERNNVADAHPVRKTELTDAIYGWLDELAPSPDAATDAARLALDRGRLGDRRATGPLARLLADEASRDDDRVEAARILGRLADPEATANLLRTMRSPNRWVAAEAAIALGRMYDDRARDRLRLLVDSEDAELRARAAVSLGRLRDARAVPGLIDALWIAPDAYEREEAVRWLGRLRDSRGLEPLIEMLPELRTRYLVVLAMGLIGDPRAYEPLVDVLRWDRHSNVRDNVVRGLALLGDRRAVGVIAPLAIDEPALENVAESLVRLDAIGARAIGGTDVAKAQAGHHGLGACHAVSPLHDWDFLHRTFCETRSAEASLRLEVPRTVQDASRVVAILGAKRADGAEPTELRVRIGGRDLPAVRVDGAWKEYRWEVEPATLRPGAERAHIRAASPGARFAVDHLLLVPRGAQGASAKSG